MSETISSELVGRRLDGLQNSVSGVARRMVTLESNLTNGTEQITAELTGLEAHVDQLATRISALETSVNCLILLVERIAKSQCRTAQEVYYPKDDGDIVGH
jgi:phage shock protein A